MDSVMYGGVNTAWDGGAGGRIDRDETEGHMLKVWGWELLLLVVGLSWRECRGNSSITTRRTTVSKEFKNLTKGKTTMSI